MEEKSSRNKSPARYRGTRPGCGVDLSRGLAAREQAEESVFVAARGLDG
jgi:hypothetical protein